MYKLTVDNLHKKFGDNEVLKGVSMKAKAGDVISIIGSSGSGKSTFLRCINFLEQPCSGQITIGSEPIQTTRDRNGSLRVADQSSCSGCARSCRWCSNTSTCGT